MTSENYEIFLGLTDKIYYPGRLHDFSPSVAYPEYRYSSDDISEENEVYDLIRTGFYTLGYDAENYGNKNWNPLSAIINEGDTVLLKPNWVMHKNKNKDFTENLECLVTHPSIVRAIIDYTLIALNGKGKIIVADAPMQGCDLEDLFKKIGYDVLVEFYKNKNIEIEWLDLRQLRVVTKGRVITDTIKINDDSKSIAIDLKSESKHLKSKGLRYKVSDYTEKKTNSYHQENKHIYSINKKVLEADVFLNLPKPKCHRLAGVTASQKNIVGIIFDKSSLPHRTVGSKSEGGDEYGKKSILKSLYAVLEEKKLSLTEKGKKFVPNLLQLLIAGIYVFVKLFSRDKVMIGSWYGNDTIWRTVADLNHILRYADKNGVLKNQQQRRFLNIADMIIAGQGDGPIGPHPKDLGIILISDNLLYLDNMCAEIMGFDVKKIPGMHEANNESKIFKQSNTIVSNKLEFNNIRFSNFKAKEFWKFDPHSFWKGNIEK